MKRYLHGLFFLVIAVWLGLVLPQPRVIATQLFKGTTTPVPTGVPGAPYPTAPLCATHDPLAYHSLWDSARGCHYDHEHGDDPGAIAGLFGVNYQQFTGSGVSYPWETTNENLAKHGGYKWTVRGTNEDACVAGDVGTNGTEGFAVEFHAKGDGAESSHATHSSFVIVRVCNAAGQTGILVTGGHQFYGVRKAPYQGVVLNYPDQTYSPYPNQSPYLDLGCFNDNGAALDCGTKAGHSDTTWVSRPQALPGGHAIAQLLFRGRDAYQWVNGSTRTTTPTYRYVCGGAVYNPVGCQANNTTETIHQVFGNVPSAWDAQDGAIDGLVSYSGYTDRWGAIVSGCTSTSLDCIPLFLLHVPVGGFSTVFDNAVLPFSAAALPERDIYFNGVPSGWVGQGN